MSERIEHFRDLRVYQKAFELQQRIFRLTECAEIGRMLGKMISEPGKWCQRFTNHKP